MEIELKFSNSISKLAGYDYGVKVFDEQVRNNLEWERENHIKFPEQINYVAISFVQGFYDEIIKKMGYDRALTDIIIESNNEKLKDRIRNCL